MGCGERYRGNRWDTGRDRDREEIYVIRGEVERNRCDMGRFREEIEREKMGGKRRDREWMDGIWGEIERE
jgi:hypothetical protein